MPPSPRELAFLSLSRWNIPADPPRVPERDDPAWSHLSPRDRAQAFDLITGVIRWRGLLDAVIAPFLRQPALDAGVRAVLWIGAYQILIQESAAPYAAVDEAVELCKTRSAERAAGMVNAVLRNILRAQPRPQPRGPLDAARFPRDQTTDIVFNRPLLPPPQPLAAHLAAVTSHPVEFVAMLLAQFPPEKTLDILIADNHRPAIHLRSDDSHFTPPAEAALTSHGTPHYFTAAQGWNPSVADLVIRGILSPQDPTAGLVAAQLANRLAPDAVICDFCAGLGTKTIQLARRMPHARIIATDIDAKKLEKLHARITETKLENITITPLPQLASFAPFDAILIDAPCSNTGVLARRVQARWRWPKLDPAAMTRLQLNLLEQGAPLLKRNADKPKSSTGVPPVSSAGACLLAYATCSIDPAENAALIKRFLSTSTSFQLVHEQTTLPTHTHDGGYLTILKC